MANRLRSEELTEKDLMQKMKGMDNMVKATCRKHGSFIWHQYGLWVDKSPTCDCGRKLKIEPAMYKEVCRLRGTHETIKQSKKTHYDKNGVKRTASLLSG